jgi:hypothetical protein
MGRVIYRCVRSRPVGFGLDRQVDAEHWPDAATHAGLGKPHRAVDTVPVGERKRVHLGLDCPLDQSVRMGGAVLQRVAGRHMQVNERIHR